jgi:hypothetical protein
MKVQSLFIFFLGGGEVGLQSKKVAFKNRPDIDWYLT